MCVPRAAVCGSTLHCAWRVYSLALVPRRCAAVWSASSEATLPADSEVASARRSRQPGRAPSSTRGLRASADPRARLPHLPPPAGNARQPPEPSPGMACRSPTARRPASTAASATPPARCTPSPLALGPATAAAASAAGAFGRQAEFHGRVVWAGCCGWLLCLVQTKARVFEGLCIAQTRNAASCLRMRGGGGQGRTATACVCARAAAGAAARGAAASRSLTARAASRERVAHRCRDPLVACVGLCGCRETPLPPYFMVEVPEPCFTAESA